MRIDVTENKSVSQLNPNNNVVRVFVNCDFLYGYWVPEHLVFSVLTQEQQAQYLESSDGFRGDIPANAVQTLVDAGHTPYEKHKVV